MDRRARSGRTDEVWSLLVLWDASISSDTRTNKTLFFFPTICNYIVGVRFYTQLHAHLHSIDTYIFTHAFEHQLSGLMWLHLASYSERSFESPLRKICCRVALSCLTQADSFIKLNENHQGTEAQLQSPCKGSQAYYRWKWHPLEPAPNFRWRGSNELAKEPNCTLHPSGALARSEPAPSCWPLACLYWSDEKLGEKQWKPRKCRSSSTD